MYKTTINEIRPWEQPFWRPARGKRVVLFHLLLIYVLAVVGLILFPLPSMRILGLTLLLTAFGGFGTTICYHRMLAHRTLKMNKAIEHLLVFWAMFNGSGAPASWVAYHRLHHARTDTPEDISSPKQGGFWWAHLRWLYQSAPEDKKRWLVPGVDSPGVQGLDLCGSSRDPAFPVRGSRARMAAFLHPRLFQFPQFRTQTARAGCLVTYLKVDEFNESHVTFRV